MKAAMARMDLDSRMEDMRKAAESEMNIDDYKVEPSQQNVMTDFF